MKNFAMLVMLVMLVFISSSCSSSSTAELTGIWKMTQSNILDICLKLDSLGSTSLSNQEKEERDKDYIKMHKNLCRFLVFKNNGEYEFYSNFQSDKVRLTDKGYYFLRNSRIGLVKIKDDLSDADLETSFKLVAPNRLITRIKVPSIGEDIVTSWLKVKKLPDNVCK